MQQPQWLTARFLSRLAEPLVIDDITFLPPSIPEVETALEMIYRLPDPRWTTQSPASVRGELLEWWREDKTLSRALPWYLQYPNVTKSQTYTLVSQLMIHYRNYRLGTGVEPPWVTDAPRFLLGHLRAEWKRWDERPGHYDAGGIIPYTGISFQVEPNGLVQRVNRAFNVERLTGIRQLSMLTNVGAINMTNEWFAQPLYPHTRWNHVLDGLVLATLVAHNNNLDPIERATIRVAAYTHDIRMKAGGDMTKFLDPSAFCEDTHYAKALESQDVQDLLRTHTIDPQTLIDVIHGKGKLGTILDIVDKIAYVARDTYYLQSWESGSRPTTLFEVDSLLQSFPTICDIWDMVRIHDACVYFDDAHRLARFLYLRAILTTSFYNHPEVQFLEALFGGLALNHLFETGFVTEQALDEHDDAWLFNLLLRFFDLPEEFQGRGVDPKELGTPRYDLFENVEKARMAEDTLIAQGFVTTILHLNFQPNPATRFLVHDNGRIIPLRETLPGASHDIEEQIRIRFPFRLYWIEDVALAPYVVEELRSIRQNQIVKEVNP